MITDFHSHLLPAIDDGAKDIRESVKLLDLMAENKIQRVVCTPHFFSGDMSINGFLSRRNAAFNNIMQYKKPQHPELLRGAEVLFSREIINNPQLHDLCIDGTDFLLLEMPYTRLSTTIIRGVSDIVDSLDVKVIIAHIERYLNFTSMDELTELMSLDVLGQINAVSLTKRRYRRACIKLFENGFAHCLGSDLHNFTRGEVTINNAKEILDKKIDKDFYGYLMHNGEKILNNREIRDF